MRERSGCGWRRVAMWRWERVSDGGCCPAGGGWGGSELGEQEPLLPRAKAGGWAIMNNFIPESK